MWEVHGVHQGPGEVGVDDQGGLVVVHDERRLLADVVAHVDDEVRGVDGHVHQVLVRQGRAAWDGASREWHGMRGTGSKRLCSV